MLVMLQSEVVTKQPPQQQQQSLEVELRRARRREEKLQALLYRLREDTASPAAFDKLRDVRGLEYELDLPVSPSVRCSVHTEHAAKSRSLGHKRKHVTHKLQHSGQQTTVPCCLGRVGWLQTWPKQAFVAQAKRALLGNPLPNIMCFNDAGTASKADSLANGTQ